LQVTFKHPRINSVLLIICFVILEISLIITWMNPAIKYEASIFKSTPLIYWIALIISLLIGFYIVILESQSARKNKLHNYSALILIIIAYISFLALWIIRGYYFWCAEDPLSHLGAINNLLTIGHIDSTNIYPITHIFVVENVKLLNLDPINLCKYIPLLYGLFFVLFMYIFAKSIFSNKEIAFYVLLVSFIPMHLWYLNLTPNHLANLTLPLAFYILIKYIYDKGYQWCILFIVMIILFPVFHPVPSLALLIMIIVLTPPGINITKKIFNKFFKFKLDMGKSTMIYSALILFVLIITWVSSFYIWNATIKNIQMLITEGGPTQLDNLGANIAYAQSYGYSVFNQFLKVYGGLVIYLTFTVIGFIIVWNKIKNNASEYIYNYKFITLLMPMMIFIIIMGLFYLTNIQAFGADRLEIYIILLSTLYVAYVLYQYVYKSSRSQNIIHKNIAIILVPVFLVFLFALAAINLYPSRFILSYNWQITKTETIGMNWLLHKKGKNNITSLSIDPGRFADALLTKTERAEIKVNDQIPVNLKIPFHFGYNENSNLGEHYNDNVYMVLKYSDLILYKEVYPNMANIRFNDNDFIRLQEDNSVNKIYENGGFESYFIYNNNKEG
jgi:hypothetical protein